MPYTNKKHANRLQNIEVAADLYGDISMAKSKGAIKTPLAGASEEQSIFLKPEPFGSSAVYNMPFLLDSSGMPWNEANSYLYDLGTHKSVSQRFTDDLHRRAARLLDYKLFTEEVGFDWLDFSGKRLTSRPTYRYFLYLTEDRGLSARVVNQYTSDVYKFYEFVSKRWHHIDMDRVDTTTKIRIYYSGIRFSGSKEVQKRSQTKAVPKSSNVSVNYIVDEGDTLRPLTLDQYNELREIINGDNWGPNERLMIWCSLWTGARKQTVLTMRYKHIQKLVESGPDGRGRYKLYAGPGTSIDTKNGKRQTLFFPKLLIDQLWIYANCKEAKDRRSKFRINYKENYPSLPSIDKHDEYLFLSDQGNCYFMAKDDPRYPIVKTRPQGQVADHLKRKILKACSDNFPRDFYYHWLRATYAHLIWLALQKHIDDGTLSYSTVISVIQRRMHHNDRKTTENYLKLFENINIKLEAQEAYEHIIFDDYLIRDVK